MPENVVAPLRERRELFTKYLQDRVNAEDWHGVMDAAADLREIAAGKPPKQAVAIAYSVKRKNRKNAG